MSGIQIDEQTMIPEEDLSWSFSRSSGPGGQNVNKVNTKATLRWQPPSGFLSEAAWRRFQSKAKRFLTLDGAVCIQSQEHRDRLQNMESCREKLRQMLVSSMKSPKKRVSTKPSKAARQRRLDEKKLNAKRKQLRNWAD